MEFQRWLVLKSKIFGQKSDMILENKVVQKLELDEKVFNKKWSPKLIFINEKKNQKNSVDF